MDLWMLKYLNAFLRFLDLGLLALYNTLFDVSVSFDHPLSRISI